MYYLGSKGCILTIMYCNNRVQMITKISAALHQYLIFYYHNIMLCRIYTIDLVLQLSTIHSKTLTLFSVFLMIFKQINQTVYFPLYSFDSFSRLNCCTSQGRVKI